MADIKLKNVNKLEEWNTKELRKLRIAIKNRLAEFQSSSKPREFKENHPLCNLDPGQCEDLLTQVKRAEKLNSRVEVEE